MTEVQTDLTPLILLARVSSETQAEKNSVERQLVQLHQWAPRHNYRVIAECIDDGVSGEILNRPGVNEAKRLIEAGEARHVAIWEHDRLGRAELVEMLILRRELMQLGATVIEATTGQVLTADDEMGELIYALNSWKGAAEKKRIVQRTNQQKRINLTKPEPTYFGGIVAYGYDVTRDKTYFIVDSEAEIVRSIFAWHLAGETPTAIANKLNAMGVPARGQGNRSNGRDDWTAQRIKDTIRNPIYKGEGRYGRKSGGKAGKPWRRNPANLHATYRLPAIVEEEAWASANEVVDRRRPRRQPNNEYALSGLIVCGMCGWSYSGGGGGYSSKTSKVRTTYYRCNSKSGYSGRHACNNKPVRVEQLERWAWDAIDSLLFTPANVEAWLDREYGGGTDHTSRLADVQKRIRQLKEEGRRLAQDLNGREGLARDLLLEQIDNLDTHLKALTSEENAIRESQESSTRRQAAAKNVQETLAKLRERFGGFHREDRAQIFRQLVDKVEILPPGQTTRAVLYLRPGLGGQTVVGLPFA